VKNIIAHGVRGNLWRRAGLRDRVGAGVEKPHAIDQVMVERGAKPVSHLCVRHRYIEKRGGSITPRHQLLRSCDVACAEVVADRRASACPDLDMACAVAGHPGPRPRALMLQDARPLLSPPVAACRGMPQPLPRWPSGLLAHRTSARPAYRLAIACLLANENLVPRVVIPAKVGGALQQRSWQLPHKSEPLLHCCPAVASDCSSPQRRHSPNLPFPTETADQVACAFARKIPS